jgi:membrane protein
MQAIERVVGVPRRAWWRQRLIALGWVLGTLVAFPIASFGIIEWDEIVHSVPPSAAASHESEGASPSGSSVAVGVGRPQGVAIVGEPRGASESAQRGWGSMKARRFLRSGGERLLAVSFSIAIAVFGLAGFYRFAVAHPHHVRRRVFPGALLAVALVIVISWGFGLYVRTLASYTVYYGSLAAIAVLLVWLWLMSLAILIGAELNSQLEGLRDLKSDNKLNS